MNFKSLSNRGFTLIELVIVIVILAILSVVAIPKYVNLANEAKASNLHGIAGAMQSGLALIHDKALIKGQSVGTGTIEINGVTIKLYNGYPAVDGSDSFLETNAQIKAWLDLDVVDRNTANANREAATFFSDKESPRNRIFIFYSADFDQKSVNFGCQVRYQNPVTITPQKPEIRVLTTAC